MPQMRSRWKNFRLNTGRSGGARELLEDGDLGGVSVRDSSGNVLCGVRLQLKLGFSANKGAGHDARSKPAMGARISPHLVALKLD